MSDGYNKAKEMRNKLKNEVDGEKKAGMEKAHVSPSPSMAMSTAEIEKMDALSVVTFGELGSNEALVKLFRETANEGMENLSSSSLPQLKVVESNSKDKLFDGSKPNAGLFFYSPTKEVYEQLSVALLTVSPGFYTVTKDAAGNMRRNENGSAQTRFNQLIGGVMLNDLKPFVIFAAGTRWKSAIDFLKSIKPITKHREYPVPMYALQVNLTTKLITTANGENHIINYSLIKNNQGEPSIISNLQVIEQIRATIPLLNEMFDGFIDNNSVDRYTGMPVAKKIDYIEEIGEAVQALTDQDVVTEDVSDDIPF